MKKREYVKFISYNLQILLLYETKKHIPILAKEIVTLLALTKNDTVLDLTTGAGGHASYFLEKIEADKYLGVDRDKDAIELAKKNLSSFGDIQIEHQNFANIEDIIHKYSLCPTVIFADLGASSMQFDTHDRGFSFRYDGPLDMRMDQTQTVTAHIVIQTKTCQELEEIFTTYGELSDFDSKNLSTAITQERQKQPIETVQQLVSIIQKINTKTKQKQNMQKHIQKVFQSLRIYVNTEIKNLERVLQSSFGILSSGGKMAFISFHSLEDRIIKHFFEKHKDRLTILTPKGIIPSEGEIFANPRSRSARLRVAEIKG